MTLDQANALLDATPNQGRLSRINRALTVYAAVGILRRALNDPATTFVEDGGVEAHGVRHGGNSEAGLT